MVSFGEKAKIKKAGNLNLGRSYVITTVTVNFFKLYEWKQNKQTILKLQSNMA